MTIFAIFNQLSPNKSSLFYFVRGDTTLLKTRQRIPVISRRDALLCRLLLFVLHRNCRVTGGCCCWGGDRLLGLSKTPVDS